MERTSVIYYDYIKLLTEVGGFYGAISSIFGLILFYLMRKSFKNELRTFL